MKFEKSGAEEGHVCTATLPNGPIVRGSFSASGIHTISIIGDIPLDLFLSLVRTVAEKVVGSGNKPPPESDPYAGGHGLL